MIWHNFFSAATISRFLCSLLDAFGIIPHMKLLSSISIMFQKSRTAITSLNILDLEQEEIRNQEKKLPSWVAPKTFLKFPRSSALDVRTH